jgi:fructose-bisphosphate aldolase, class II
MIPSMVRGAEHKRLDIPRIAAIKNAVQVPLTLHGGSGTDAEDFRKSIKAGITMIHINTELRVAWRTGLAEALNPHFSQLGRRGMKFVRIGSCELISQGAVV